MAVSALFSEDPPELGIEEGYPEAELVCVSPGQAFAGERVLKLPFTRKDPPDHERPNPFTPWGAGNYEVPIEEGREEKVSSFQMGVQVFRLPEGLVADYEKERFAGRGRIIVSSWDTVKQSVACGRYWAVCLSQVENRSVETTDFADWVLSPVYRVEWPVGSHPPVGLKIGDPGGLLE